MYIFVSIIHLGYKIPFSKKIIKLIEEKHEYLNLLAASLFDNKKAMSGEELAKHLNRNGFETTYGSEYTGKRGVYKLIESTYVWSEQKFGAESCHKVARAFVKSDGSYAYEK